MWARLRSTCKWVVTSRIRKRRRLRLPDGFAVELSLGRRRKADKCVVTGKLPFLRYAALEQQQRLRIGAAGEREDGSIDQTVL